MAGKKRVAGLFAFFLLIALFANPSYAQDFSASTMPSVSVCPCSNQEYKVAVTNVGPVKASYNVAAAGNASPFITFEPSRFELNPGQSAAFRAIANSACNIKGNFGLEIYITANNNLTKLIRQNINVKECYDYAINPGEVAVAAESIAYKAHAGIYGLCTDEKKSIPILIKNNEGFGNEYSLLLDAPEWASLNTDKARLDGKQQGVVLINYDTAGVLGDFTINLNAISSLGKVQRKASLNLIVNKCYDLGIISESKEPICSGELSEKLVLVRNSGTIPQEIVLDTAGIEWANFANETQLTLNPGDERAVILSIQPEETVSGIFEGKISAIPDNKTQFAAYLPVQMEFIEKLSCYEADISARAVIRNTYEEDVFFAKVRNNGIKKADYAVRLEGPGWAAISPEHLELNPGQSGNLNIRINPQDAEPGTYGIKIVLESSGAVYSENVNIRLREKTGLEKWIESTIKKYRYYLYVLVAIVALALIFMKQVMKVRDNIKEWRRKRQIRKQRIINLRLAREKRLAEKKIQDTKESKTKKPVKFRNKYKVGAALLVLLGLILGQFLGIYNLKYMPIYVKNILVGYLYYILIGIGIVILLFAAVLLYNRFRKRPGKKASTQKTINERKKPEKRSGKGRWYHSPGKAIAVFIPVIAAVTALAYFNFFDRILDFVVLYSYYFVLGIILLVAIILALTFYRPLTGFFRKK